MRYQFIENHRELFPVQRMCKVLAVSPSGYYAWRKRPVSRLKMANNRLLAKIKEIHVEFEGRYGYNAPIFLDNKNGYAKLANEL